MSSSNKSDNDASDTRDTRKWIEVIDGEGYWLENKKKHKSDIHKIPATCPLCHFIMKNNIDTTSFLRFECCSRCYTQFIEGRVERWKDGWRPDSIELDKYIRKRKNLPPQPLQR